MIVVHKGKEDNIKQLYLFWSHITKGKGGDMWAVGSKGTKQKQNNTH